jgi:hypothetical protein
MFLGGYARALLRASRHNPLLLNRIITAISSSAGM